MFVIYKHSVSITHQKCLFDRFLETWPKTAYGAFIALYEMIKSGGFSVDLLALGQQIACSKQHHKQQR